MRCGSGGTPAGSMVDGKVQDAAGVGMALRQLLARSEINETRALVAASDAIATFRILNVPPSMPESNVDSVVTKEFPLDPRRLAVKWVDVDINAENRVIFAAAWDRAAANAIIEAVKAAGLDPVVIELKSVCVARTVSEASCLVIDASSNPIEAVLIDDYIPRLWHAFESATGGGDDLALALAEPLRAVLRFQSTQRDSAFGPQSPVLIAADQVFSLPAMTGLSQAIQHPVHQLPIPPRVPDIRYATYLTCLGLLMRRT